MPRNVDCSVLNRRLSLRFFASSQRRRLQTRLTSSESSVYHVVATARLCSSERDLCFSPFLLVTCHKNSNKRSSNSTCDWLAMAINLRNHLPLSNPRSSMRHCQSKSWLWTNLMEQNYEGLDSKQSNLNLHLFKPLSITNRYMKWRGRKHPYAFTLQNPS